MLEQIGGRKFLMAIVLTIAGIIIEVFGKNGLSTNMAGMLAAIYATFSAGNVISSNKALSVNQSTSDNQAAAEPIEKVSSINADEVAQGFMAVDQAYTGMQQQLAAQAEQINVLQKTILGKGASNAKI
jgi:hypothetical protein